MLSHINVGTGKDVTIREMAETMKEVIGFKGKLTFDRLQFKVPGRTGGVLKIDEVRVSKNLEDVM